MEKAKFAIIGTGWRAGFFLRVACEIPEKFEVCGIVTRSEEKAKDLEAQRGVKAFTSMRDLLKAVSPAFVVVSVPAANASDYILELAADGIPVLTETPPALDFEMLNRLNALAFEGARIQVAEQYHLQPLHAARLGIAASGRLGEINEVQLSFATDTMQ